MHSQQLHIILLLATFSLSLFLMIAAAKYAEWAHAMINDSGDWLSLVFYVGSIPLLSLFLTTIHLSALHFDAIPAPADPGSTSAAILIMGISIVGFIAWIAQASICTACELGPILAGTQGDVPSWCPQSHFHDVVNQAELPDQLAQLATVKDLVQWGMVVISVGLMECARRGWMTAERLEPLMGLELGSVRELDGKDVDGESFELHDITSYALKRSGTVTYESRV